MHKLSIIIPCYNEARTIEEILRRVEAAPMPPLWEKEVIFVDHASTDGTRDILRSLEPRVRVLYCEHNDGKGTAFSRGLAVATGTHMVTQDADLEYDPQEIQLLLEPIIAGRADAVYGSRAPRPQGRYGAAGARLGGGGGGKRIKFFL